MHYGASNRIRTDDPFLTMEVLCQLGYGGPSDGRVSARRYRKVKVVGGGGFEPP